MKKVIISLIFAITLCSVYAKGFFSERYFEIKTSVPVGLSNNAISFNDFFQKELVIDLRELSNKVPEDGFNISAKANPSYGMNLRIANIFLGFSTGFDLWENFNISKDLFDLLGKGNEPEEETNISFKNNLDLFFNFNTDFGIKFKGNELHIKPSAFIPIVSSYGDLAKLTTVNDENGKLDISFATDMGFYSLFNLDQPDIKFDAEFFSHMGFDIGGSFRHPFGNIFTLEVDGKIPVVPGSLPYLKKIENKFNMSMSFLGDDSEDEEDLNEVDEESGSLNYVLEDQQFYINRPMKISGYLECAPMGSLLVFRAGVGIGVFHPFVSGYEVYADTYFGARLNLGLLKAGVSTEYTDKIFKHQLDLSVNLRLIEIETGISLQASNFTKSFTGTGYGAFVNVSVGF